MKEQPKLIYVNVCLFVMTFAFFEEGIGGEEEEEET